MSNELRDSVVLTNEGKKLFAIFHRPAHVSPFPAVLICHGFAGTKVGRHRIYVSLAEALVERGIGALRIDFRGCGDSEGPFDEVTLESQVSDALVGLNYLNNHDQVDKSRIGLLGRSMGGPVAVMAAARFQIIQSLALWCPVFSAQPWIADWAQALHQPQAVQSERNPTVMFLGYRTAQKLFEQLFATDIQQELHTLAQVPLLHVHSERDEVVKVAHADDYIRCRQRVNGPSQFIRLKDSDHEFSLLSERQYAIEETAAWFQKTLSC